MSRVQLALNVDNLDEAVAFYSKLFNTEPAKVKPGYANFAVAEPPLKLVLIENRGYGGSLNHLGIEVTSSDAVHAEIAHLPTPTCLPKKKSTPPAASPSRTRYGSPPPTVLSGRSTPCWPTLKPSDLTPTKRIRLAARAGKRLASAAIATELR